MTAVTPSATSLGELDYRAKTEAVFASIEASIDRWLQEDVVDIDVQRSGGLLEMSFGDGSKMVVNTQPPLQEIWLAARAGGYHFRYVDGRWIDTRSGDDFFTALSARASEQAGMPLTFEAAE